MHQALISHSDSCFGSTNHTMTRCCSSEVKVCRPHLYCAALLLWCHNGRNPFFGFPQWVLPKTGTMCLFGALPLWKMGIRIASNCMFNTCNFGKQGYADSIKRNGYILICFPTLTAHHQSNNNLVFYLVFNSIQRGSSQHIVNAQHFYMGMTLPAVAHTVHMCLSMFVSAASGREREKESDGSQRLVWSQWLGC